MQYGGVARCGAYCIDDFGVGGIDDFGVRALLCVCVCYSIGGVLRGGVLPHTHVTPTFRNLQ